MTQAACLYCETTKPLDHFNREHVLSECFGRYEGNFVLIHLVCEECNSYFANNLELRLGRGSYEGIERFRLGIAPKSKTRGATKNQRFVEARRDGGPHDGAFYEWQLSNSGTVIPVQQIGVARSEAGPFTWYRASGCPTGDELRAQGFAKGATCFQLAGFTPEQGIQFLRGLGYEPEENPQVMPEDVDPDGKVALKIGGTIDRVLMRAVAKIAFNYLIYHYPAIASMGQFAPIRRYIRYDETPPFQAVTVSEQQILGGFPEGHQLLAHVVTVGWKGPNRGVVAQVSLFTWVQYVVQLAEDNFLMPPLCVDSGHIFNPFSHQILRLTRHKELARQNVPMKKLD